MIIDAPTIEGQRAVIAWLGETRYIPAESSIRRFGPLVAYRVFVGVQSNSRLVDWYIRTFETLPTIPVVRWRRGGPS